VDIEQASETSDELVAAFEHLTPQLSPGHLPPTRAELDALLAQPGCSLLLARQAGQICGVLTLIIFRTPMAVHAWIEDVVVDTEFRGQGIGEALTRRAIDLAKEHGADNINLTSRPSREAANRLYQRMGFQRWETNLYRIVLRKS